MSNPFEKAPTGTWLEEVDTDEKRENQERELARVLFYQVRGFFSNRLTETLFKKRAGGILKELSPHAIEKNRRFADDNIMEIERRDEFTKENPQYNFDWDKTSLHILNMAKEGRTMPTIAVLDFQSWYETQTIKSLKRTIKLEDGITGDEEVIRERAEFFEQALGINPEQFMDNERWLKEQNEFRKKEVRGYAELQGSSNNLRDELIQKIPELKLNLTHNDLVAWASEELEKLKKKLTDDDTTSEKKSRAKEEYKILDRLLVGGKYSVEEINDLFSLLDRRLRSLRIREAKILVDYIFNGLDQGERSDKHEKKLLQIQKKILTLREFKLKIGTGE